MTISPLSNTSGNLADEDRNSILAALIGQLARLDEVGARLAAAHLDRAIDAYCDQFKIERSRSEME